MWWCLVLCFRIGDWCLFVLLRDTSVFSFYLFFFLHKVLTAVSIFVITALPHAPFIFDISPLEPHWCLSNISSFFTFWVNMHGDLLIAVPPAVGSGFISHAIAPRVRPLSALQYRGTDEMTRPCCLCLLWLRTSLSGYQWPRFRFRVWTQTRPSPFLLLCPFTLFLSPIIMSLS